MSATTFEFNAWIRRWKQEYPRWFKNNPRQTAWETSRLVFCKFSDNLKCFAANLISLLRSINIQCVAHLCYNFEFTHVQYQNSPWSQMPRKTEFALLLVMFTVYSDWMRCLWSQLWNFYWTDFVRHWTHSWRFVRSFLKITQTRT